MPRLGNMPHANLGLDGNCRVRFALETDRTLWENCLLSGARMDLPATRPSETGKEYLLNGEIIR